MFQELVRFVGGDDVRNNKMGEVFQIFHKMKNSGSFLYSATPATIDGLTSSSKTMGYLIYK
jgi:hypothetical protein